jgi:D-arabinose 1-dehydrogenase-like Zn-dependent alcohol dehydrogenase
MLLIVSQGHEGCGEIVQVGDQVTKFKVVRKLTPHTIVTFKNA